MPSKILEREESLENYVNQNYLIEETDNNVQQQAKQSLKTIISQTTSKKNQAIKSNDKRDSIDEVKVKSRIQRKSFTNTADVKDKYDNQRERSHQNSNIIININKQINFNTITQDKRKQDFGLPKQKESSKARDYLGLYLPEQINDSYSSANIKQYDYIQSHSRDLSNYQNITIQDETYGNNQTLAVGLRVMPGYLRQLKKSHIQNDPSISNNINQKDEVLKYLERTHHRLSSVANHDRSQNSLEMLRQAQNRSELMMREDAEQEDAEDSSTRQTEKFLHNLNVKSSIGGPNMPKFNNQAVITARSKGNSQKPLKLEQINNSSNRIRLQTINNHIDSEIKAQIGGGGLSDRKMINDTDRNLNTMSLPKSVISKFRSLDQKLRTFKRSPNALRPAPGILRPLEIGGLSFQCIQILEQDKFQHINPSPNGNFVGRKRTFSESFILGQNFSSGDKLAAKINAQNQNPKDQQDLQINQQNTQIQEISQDFSSDSRTPESSSGLNDQKQGDLSSKKKKVTQAQLMGKTAGRWTKEEHKKFVQAIRLFGKDWRKVEDFVETRSGAQIRSHAQKYFIRIQKKLKNSDALDYLNQTEDQCNTTRGLELFRQAISLYEDGSQKDQNEDDDDFTSASTIVKRQKLSTNDIINSKRGSHNLSTDKSLDTEQLLKLYENQNTNESPINKSAIIFQQRSEIIPVQMSQNSSSNNFFLSNEKKMVQGQFYELVKRKENLMSEIYQNDRVDLFSDVTQVIDNSQQTTTGNSILERMLILINEIMNLQKILTDSANDSSLNPIKFYKLAQSQPRNEQQSIDQFVLPDFPALIIGDSANVASLKQLTGYKLKSVKSTNQSVEWFSCIAVACDLSFTIGLQQLSNQTLTTVLIMCQERELQFNSSTVIQ
ncbi:myb-like dna-binding shaqkyf class family protein [Stylonychia lemnae]|uniref:Myb-like dna-binding shaqkyf class family protein n=1 Tax=Stylonychia lemnae TaxID=5949 RepID=A0A077ZT46_STYLE|nr:myb-like dna-binding shaqkyf class family protein [Stylonychia lemnae]|eukprot:CDW72485.1 myb-like dna-binding shaqkyf class family protein [Stylonychia lemnae]